MAFGNYLNSSKRGPAYGFRLQSLDTLLDTKSTDKKLSLLHYIVSTIRQNFPDLLNFDSEFFCIDKASQVSLENVITDVNELEKGMEVVRREVEQRGKNAQNLVLKDFLTNSEEKLKKISADTKVSQASFKECLEFFGESSRNPDANAFFSLLVRFVKAFKVCAAVLHVSIIFIKSFDFLADNRSRERAAKALGASRGTRGAEEGGRRSSGAQEQEQSEEATSKALHPFMLTASTNRPPHASPLDANPLEIH